MPPKPRGYAAQVRINTEFINSQGIVRPARGQLERFDQPCGPDVRVDTHGYTGYEPSPNYDPLLAKLIVTAKSDRFIDVVRRLQRALAEFCIVGLPTNLHLLRALVGGEEFSTQRVHTRHFESILPELLTATQSIADAEAARDQAMELGALVPAAEVCGVADLDEPIGEGRLAIRAPVSGRIVELPSKDDIVQPGQTVAVSDSMKMEHSIVAECAGRVVDVRLNADAQAVKGEVLFVMKPTRGTDQTVKSAEECDPRAIRPDLQRVLDRHAYLYDEARPEAVAKRHSRGQCTARENISDLCDPGTFVEYGALAVAAQASRRSQADLIANTPADGLITGIGGVNGTRFPPDRSRCAMLAYDATVLAGTQGKRNHTKTDLILDVALKNRLPTFLFAEGGGGRPGDVDFPTVAGLYQPAFSMFASLSGEVPVLGIVSGRCFAGNAALLGCCDVIIATRDANIGMAGPAMVQGGGLGAFRPEDIGPSSVQYRNGVVDLPVDDEAAAVAAAKQYLSMFQGALSEWQAPDPLLLRDVVPENRLRVYDTRAFIAGIADVGSVLELRAGFGIGIHTALAQNERQQREWQAASPLTVIFRKADTSDTTR